MATVWYVATIVTALQFMCISLIHSIKKRIKSYTATATEESRSGFFFYANGRHKETFEMQNSDSLIELFLVREPESNRGLDAGMQQPFRHQPPPYWPLYKTMSD